MRRWKQQGEFAFVRLRTQGLYYYLPLKVVVDVMSMLKAI
jgi:hypothetical protein